MRRVEIVPAPEGSEARAIRLARRLRDALTDIDVEVTDSPSTDSVIIALEPDSELLASRDKQTIISFTSSSKSRSHWLMRGVEPVDPAVFEELVARTIVEIEGRAHAGDETPEPGEFLDGVNHTRRGDVRAPMQPLSIVQDTFQLVSQFCDDAAVAYYEYGDEVERLELFAESEEGTFPDSIARDELTSEVVGPLSGKVCPVCATRDDVESECFFAHVVSKTRHYGHLVVLVRASSRSSQDLMEGIENSARQLAVALESAHLFGQARSAYSRLREAKDQLVHSEKFAAVGVLAAEIAHEINNPASFVITNLSVLGEYAETIASFHRAVREAVDEGALSPEELSALEKEHEIGWLEEDVESLIDRSLSGLERIHQIVRDLRFTSHVSPTSSGWVNVERLIEAALGLVRHEAKFRASIELDFGGIPMVQSDPNRLSQVFLNLLVNAVQSIEPGAIDENRVSVRTWADADCVRIAVEDTGSGIEPSKLDRIFEPFFTTKEPGAGTGLGLSISRDIVRGLGGEIEVDSTPGVGSTFVVKLPAPEESTG